MAWPHIGFLITLRTCLNDLVVQPHSLQLGQAFTLIRYTENRAQSVHKLTITP